MEVRKALSQISEIHEHLTRAELYRGYRSVPVALSGVLALLAAALQPVLVGTESPRGFVIYWVCVAIFGSVTAGGGIVRNYLREEDPRVRRKTRVVVGQLLPCLVAGIIATMAITPIGRPGIVFLPGLWAMLYSLGIFASRPYLSRIIGWVALFYLISGTTLLLMAPQGGTLSPWGLGLVFGLGQIFGAIVLYWNLERNQSA